MTKTILQKSVKIRFQDCDILGHLYNSRYIDYLLNVREEVILDTLGFNLYSHSFTSRKGWVVGSHEIHYAEPSRILETVTCESRIIDFKSRTSLVEMLMFNEERTRLKCMMWTHFVYFDLDSKKSIAHDAEILDMFQVNHHSRENVTDFKLRIHELKDSLKY